MPSLRTLLVLLLFSATRVLSCSRVTYHAGIDERITTGRSMDFVASTNSSMYIFPAGLNRNGSVGQNSKSWTSKYGSMVTTMYDKISIDGMNSEGLSGSLLYLGNSDYGARNTSRPGLPIGLWMQYFLDLYPTVAAAAEALQSDDLQIVTKALVPGVSSTAHLALSDKSGDNMIVEYLDGKMIIHHGEEYPVMTNDPSFDDQLTLNTYWGPISNVSLPGTGSPAGEFWLVYAGNSITMVRNNANECLIIDRFVRLSYYNSLAPESKDLMTSVATTAAMIRAVSVPFVPESQINTGLDVWPTLWRVYQDSKDMVYFYESSMVPISIYMRFSDYDLSSTGKILRLGLAEESWEDLYGDMNGKFTNATAFVPLGA